MANLGEVLSFMVKGMDPEDPTTEEEVADYLASIGELETQPTNPVTKKPPASPFTLGPNAGLSPAEVSGIIGRDLSTAPPKELAVNAGAGNIQQDILTQQAQAAAQSPLEELLGAFGAVQAPEPILPSIRSVAPNRAAGVNPQLTQILLRALQPSKAPGVSPLSALIGK